MNRILPQRSVQKNHLNHSSTGVKCISPSHDHHTNNVWQVEGDFCLRLASTPTREDPDLESEALAVLWKIISTSWSENSCWESVHLQRVLLLTTKTKVKARKTASDSRFLDFSPTDTGLCFNAHWKKTSKKKKNRRHDASRVEYFCTKD